MHILFLFIFLFLTACSSDNDNNNTNNQDTTQTIAVDIPFTATVGSVPAECGTDKVYYSVGSALSSIEIADVRFYVFDVKLVKQDDSEITVNLDQNAWQYENIALLDFEDATGLCANGTSETNTNITGTIEDFANEDYKAIRFSVGVPFEHNHQDTAAAPSPLNLPAMFWSWQAGYKFIRVDLRTDREPRDETDTQSWFIHLGSTGCTSEAKDQAPVTTCTEPNRVENITLENFDLETSTVVFDLESFLNTTNLSVSTPMPDGCMSGLEDPDCPSVFTSLGLSQETGACVEENCTGQSAFSLQ